MNISNFEDFSIIPPRLKLADVYISVDCTFCKIFFGYEPPVGAAVTLYVAQIPKAVFDIEGFLNDISVFYVRLQLVLYLVKVSQQ